MRTIECNTLNRCGAIVRFPILILHNFPRLALARASLRKITSELRSETENAPRANLVAQFSYMLDARSRATRCYTLNGAGNVPTLLQPILQST